MGVERKPDAPADFEAQAIERRVRARGLLVASEPVVVLLSGGRDSTVLLDLAVRIAGADSVVALHVDYGLREAARDDADACRALGVRLGVEAIVERAGAAPERGNLQAWARDRRYALASRVALARNARVAAGHTASDQVETVLYRLAASPGRRALLGMPSTSGRLIRPLLDVTREGVTAYAVARGLTWREDASNADPAYARNRVRHGVVEALRAVHPAAEANVLATLGVLRDEAEVLDAAVDAALATVDGRVDALAAQPSALRRLVLQRLADDAAGGRAAAVGARVDDVLALADRGKSASLDLGGVTAWVEYGRLRLTASGAPAPVPEPTALCVPGGVAFGLGWLTASREVGDGLLDPTRLGRSVVVRARRPGDRMRVDGGSGSRSLQDLFVDRRIPRSRRDSLPVVLCGERVAWVAEVGVDAAFAAAPGALDGVRIRWEPYSGAT